VGLLDADIEITAPGFASSASHASGLGRIDIGTITAVAQTFVLPDANDQSRVFELVATAESEALPDAAARSRVVDVLVASAESEVLPDARVSSKVIEELTPI
jgi:hypothetical protein